MEEKNTKSTALLVLGAIAVIAVIGLVMMFVQSKETTGAWGAWPKLYGGSATKMNPYPYFTNRGVPAEIFDDNLRTAVLRTPEVAYQGINPPSNLGWQGQGPSGPAQTYTYQWNAGAQRLSSLSIQELSLIHI